MQVELKNLKIHDDMSDETLCFSATIYVDGKKVATAQNHGQGACCMFYPFDNAFEDFKKLEQFAKEKHGEFEPVDALVYELITETENKRVIARMKKKGYTPFRLKEDGETVSRYVKSNDPKVPAWLKSKYGKELVQIY